MEAGLIDGVSVGAELRTSPAAERLPEGDSVSMGHHVVQNGVDGAAGAREGMTK